tara:strand:+ start:1109 stop:1978 length:870 start_codon:yes stop_codon:yes gene_type:complete
MKKANHFMAQTLNYIVQKKVMKKLLFALSILSLVSINGFALAQNQESKDEFQFQKVEHHAFQAGEVLHFKLAYGFINAGTATIEIKPVERKIKDRELLHIVGTGKSVSSFDWFFKVRDRYETYLDKEGVFPWLFVRRIHEGGYEKEQDYQFFQDQGYVKNEDDETYEVPHGIQDMLSSFYYARTIDFSNAKKGDVFEFVSFVDEEIYPLRIRYAGDETVKIKKGKFKCMKFHPVVQEGRIFAEDDDLTVYITKDENKIPILAKAKVLVGSIRMELTDYENLANPIAKLD